MSSPRVGLWLLFGAAAGGVVGLVVGRLWLPVGVIAGAWCATVALRLVADGKRIAKRVGAQPTCIGCPRRVVMATHRVRCFCGRVYFAPDHDSVELIELVPSEHVATRTERARFRLWREWEPSILELAPEHRTFVTEWVAFAKTGELPPMSLAARPSWWRVPPVALFGGGGIGVWLAIAAAAARFEQPRASWFVLALSMSAASISIVVPALASRIDARDVYGWAGWRTRAIPWTNVREVRVRFGRVEVVAQDGETVGLPTMSFVDPDSIAAIVVRHAPADVAVRFPTEPA